MIKFLYAVAVIIGFASTAYALRCHVCDGAVAPSCADPLKAGETFATECKKKPENPSESVTGCMTSTFKSPTGNIVTSRECYYGDISLVKEICQKTEELMQGLAKDLKCDICTKDLCNMFNSSTSTGIFTATVVFLVVIVRLIS